MTQLPVTDGNEQTRSGINGVEVKDVWRFEPRSYSVLLTEDRCNCSGSVWVLWAGGSVLFRFRNGSSSNRIATVRWFWAARAGVFACWRSVHSGAGGVADPVVFKECSERERVAWLLDSL